MKRRSFLAFMGTAPLAAKAAADATIAEAAGLLKAGSGGGYLGIGAGVNAATPSTLGLSDKFVPFKERQNRAAAYIKSFGLPEFVEVGMRERARHFSALDPDIACKTSWSMSVKIMTQRQRNFERELATMNKGSCLWDKRDSLTKILGFEWPW